MSHPLMPTTYAFTLCVAATLVPVSPTFADDLRRVQGNWDIVRHATGGLGIGSPDGSGDPLGPTVTISGNQMTMTHPNGVKEHYKIRCVDEETRLKQCEITSEHEGQRIKQAGIYRIRKDRIDCLLAPAGVERPSEFTDSPTGDDRFFILRRRK